MNLNNTSNRRDFLKKSGSLAAVGLFSGTLVSMLCSCEKDEIINVKKQSLGLDLTQPKYSSLLTVMGEPVSIDLSSSFTVLVRRTGPTTFGIFSNKCPHLGADIIIPAPGADYYCTLHKATFDTATGHLKNDPPSMGKSLVPIMTYIFDATNNTLQINVG